jgi:hypothetical protein
MARLLNETWYSVPTPSGQLAVGYPARHNESNKNVNERDELSGPMHQIGHEIEKIGDHGTGRAARRCALLSSGTQENLGRRLIKVSRPAGVPRPSPGALASGNGHIVLADFSQPGNQSHEAISCIQ